MGLKCTGTDYQAEVDPDMELRLDVAETGWSEADVRDDGYWIALDSGTRNLGILLG